jgi:hypothetical protein
MYQRLDPLQALPLWRGALHPAAWALPAPAPRLLPSTRPDPHSPPLPQA